MTATRYTGFAMTLHWLMAVLVIGLFALGLYMHDLPLSPEKLKLYSWHKWAGVCAFALLIVRLVWRLLNRPPVLPEHMSRFEQFAAHATHHLFYFLMIAIPLSGWLMSSAKGFQTVLFGVLPLPDLLDKNKETGDMLQTLHWALNMLLGLMVLGHAAAALKHHFIDKDDVLVRMLPSFIRQSR